MIATALTSHTGACLEVVVGVAVSSVAVSSGVSVGLRLNGTVAVGVGIFVVVGLGVSEGETRRMGVSDAIIVGAVADGDGADATGIQPAKNNIRLTPSMAVQVLCWRDRALVFIASSNLSPISLLVRMFALPTNFTSDRAVHLSICFLSRQIQV